MDDIDVGSTLSRRRFLGLAGGAAGTAWLLGPGALPAGAQVVDEPSAVVVGITTRVLRRRLDQLQLRYRFAGWGIQRRTGQVSRLVRVGVGPHRITVELPPQAVVEGVINAADPTPGAPANGPFRFAGASRLVFDIPDSIETISLADDDSLLDWSQWQLRVAQRARYAGPPPGGVVVGYRTPLDSETAIELPWMTYISPNEHCTFLGNTSPKGGGTESRVEAWEARLARRPGPTPVDALSIRAIYLRDPQAADWIADPAGARGPQIGAGFPFPMALTPRQRAGIVVNTSGWERGSPTAAPVDDLRVGALGGALETRVRFDTPIDPGIESWSHKTTQGRDHYVRIVSPGYLLPWGFPVALVSVTERRILNAAGGAGPVAVLTKRDYVEVRDPFVNYQPGASERDDIPLRMGGRRLPFTSARLRAKTSPLLNLVRPAVGDGGQALVLPDNTTLLWDVVLTDHVGRESSVAMPLVFVDKGVNADVVKMTSLILAYAEDTGLNAVDLRGQAVAFTPEAVPGQSTLPTGAMTVALDYREPTPTDAFILEPYSNGADVDLPAAAVTGGSAPSRRISYYFPYLESGFGAGQVWARISGEPIELGFRVDRAGGVLLPNTDLGAISRNQGLVGGHIDTAAAGQFDPGEWFGSENKLLGCVDLSDIVEGGAQPPDAIPALTTTVLPDVVEHRYAWRPKLKDSGIFEALSGRAEITAALRSFPADPARTEVDVRGDLGRCILFLPERDDFILKLPFEAIRFRSRSGQRPELEVDIDVEEIAFGGPLDFVRGLRRYLSFGGDDGPSVEVTDDAIAVDVSAELPDIKVGVFSLYDLDFSGGVELPLDGGPILTRFGLGSRSNPFHLTCFGIGGGGYFEIATGGGELKRLSLGLEAGCEVAIDFGPFSAGIGCYVGIVISLTEDGLGFTGYFRMFGEIDVAIASASISLYLGLEYRPGPGDLYGTATLIIEVTVLFFSESLEFEVERRFNSCDNDPPFRDMLDQPAWTSYCAAFGPVTHATADGGGGPS